MLPCVCALCCSHACLTVATGVDVLVTTSARWGWGCGVGVRGVGGGGGGVWGGGCGAKEVVVAQCRVRWLSFRFTGSRSPGRREDVHPAAPVRPGGWIGMGIADGIYAPPMSSPVPEGHMHRTAHGVSLGSNHG